MRCYDTKEPLLHYFSTPQHYIAAVGHHSSTLTSYSLHLHSPCRRSSHIAKLHGGASLGKRECETTGYGEGERKEKW